MSRRLVAGKARPELKAPPAERYILVDGEPVLEQDSGRWEAFARRWQDHILRRDIYICRPDGRLDAVDPCHACMERQREAGGILITVETTFWVYDPPARWVTKGVIDEGVRWSASRAAALVTHLEAVVALHVASVDKRLPGAWIEQERIDRHSLAELSPGKS